MNSFLQDFLLLKSTNIDHVLSIVKNVSGPLLTITFVLGAVFENLGNQNFLGLFKRLIIALFLISFGSSILKSSVSLSFDISSKILSSAQKTNPVVQLIDRARRLSQEPSKKESQGSGLIEKSKNASSALWESTAFVTKLFLDDGMSSVIFVISYVALLLLGQFYTIVYNFTYVSIPIIATLIVFPPTYSVANSISRTISWVFLMPIFTMITILLLSMSFAFPQDMSQEIYFASFENLINFCIMAIMLLLIPTIVSGFLSGSGILSAAESFSNTTAMAMATGGKGLVLNGLKNLGGKALHGSNYGLVTLGKLGVNRGLDKLGHQSIAAKKRLKSQDNFSSSSKGTSNQVDSREKNNSAQNNHTSESQESTVSSRSNSRFTFASKAIDRSVVLSDSVLNFKKNHMASKALQQDLKETSSSMPKEMRSELFNKYKKEAHRGARYQRPIDYKVRELRSGKDSSKLGYQSLNTRYSTRNSKAIKRETRA